MQMNESTGFSGTRSQTMRPRCRHARWAGTRWALVVALALSPPAFAQITFDNASSSNATATSLAFSHTIGGGQGRLLVLEIAVEGTNPFNADVTAIPRYNGVFLTLAVENVTGTSFGMNTEIWS